MVLQQQSCLLVIAKLQSEYQDAKNLSHSPSINYAWPPKEKQISRKSKSPWHIAKSFFIFYPWFGQVINTCLRRQALARLSFLSIQNQYYSTIDKSKIRCIISLKYQERGILWRHNEPQYTRNMYLSLWGFKPHHKRTSSTCIQWMGYTSRRRCTDVHTRQK